MIYPSYVTLAVAVVLSLQSVLAAPMPMDARIGDDGPNKKLVQDTMPVVNQKLKNMKAVINLPDAQAKAHPATVRAFGHNANVHEIRKNIDTLDKSKIMIPDTHPEPILTQGGTYPNGHIKFGSSFYSSDANTRAGTILHEASHSKLGTVDHFKANGQPGGKGDPYVGYKDSHMDHLNAHHSDQMHHNADAYRVFGDSCPNVRRSLYRRAMAEPHPVARSELLRRAAAACAWKPKAKAAAGKEAAKKAVDPKAKGSQKSVSAKRPLAAKSAKSAKSASKTAKGAHVPANKKAAAKPAHRPTTASKKSAAKPVQQHSAKKAAVKAPKFKPAKAAPKPVHHSTKAAVKAPKAKSAKAAAKSVQHSVKKPVVQTPKVAAKASKPTAAKAAKPVAAKGKKH